MCLCGQRPLATIILYCVNYNLFGGVLVLNYDRHHIDTDHLGVFLMDVQTIFSSHILTLFFQTPSCDVSL